MPSNDEFQEAMLLCQKYKLFFLDNYNICSQFPQGKLIIVHQLFSLSSNQE